MMGTIEKVDLRTVDLNLLVAFDALMQTRSVTKAAERLRVGQPSASYSLKRLRILFGDPLFVRTPSGMAPTPRALALDAAIRSILSTIETTLRVSPTFDPQSASRIFRIGANDYAQTVIADPLVSALLAASPRSKALLSATACEVVGRSLERGEIDVALGVFPNVATMPRRHLLYRERYECVFDPEACGLEPPISRAQWLDIPHVIMSTNGDYLGPIDEVLRSRGEHRNVTVSTTNFLVIPHLLKGKRLVAALPSRLARLCRVSLGLASCPLPVEAAELDVLMIWHPRTDSEPGAVWLREQIVRSCQACSTTT